jgi:hypothetical protein
MLLLTTMMMLMKNIMKEANADDKHKEEKTKKNLLPIMQ